MVSFSIHLSGHYSRHARRNLLACRLARIREIAGHGGHQDAALHALLEGDFEPEDYDQRMAAAFGDDYYGVSFCPHHLGHLCTSVHHAFLLALMHHYAPDSSMPAVPA